MTLVRGAAVRAAFGALCIAVAGVSGATATAAAQSVRPYRPAFDVANYDLTIDLPDSGAVIHGRAVLDVARRAPADTLLLDLLDLDVNSVTVDGRAVRFARRPGEIAIPLPAKRGATPVFSVAVDYGGAVQDGLIVRTDSAGRWTYFGDNFPDRARHWIPSIDHPSDKATVTWHVRAPASQTVVANGRLVGTRIIRDASGTDRTETEWRESRPISVYLMVIAAAPLTRFDLGDTACGLAEGQACVPQSVYTAPEQAAYMPGPFARAGEIVQLFAHLVGPFPYEKLSHLQSSTRFGGMENASEIFYSDAAFRRRSMTDGLIAHETAHQWFGDAVTEREWGHLWLSEGFATYFAALWTRAADGDSAFRVQMASVRRTVVTDTIAVTSRPVIDTAQHDYLALLNRNSYEKGGFVLHMLRAQVGEGAFFGALRAYYAAHRNSTALTDDLQAEMERSSGQQLGWFFDQWLRRPGYAEVTARWSYDVATGDVVVRLTQSDRFGAFEMPVDVEVVDAAGLRRRGSVRMPARDGVTTELRIPLGATPALVVVDPDVNALATITVVPP